MQVSERIGKIQEALEKMTDDDLAEINRGITLLTKNPTFDKAQVWEIARALDRMEFHR